MSKPFARKFYSSQAWRDCRERYAAKALHLCEDCLARGIYRPGEIVHHVIELDPVSIEKPEISLNFDNLRLVCRECHAAAHKSGAKERRFIVGEDGKILPRDN